MLDDIRYTRCSIMGCHAEHVTASEAIAPARRAFDSGVARWSTSSATSASATGLA
jgi:hypothetical protein